MNCSLRFIRFYFALLAAALFLPAAASTAIAAETQPVAGQPASWQLLSQVEVDSQGIYLDQLLAVPPEQALPRIRLAPSPTLGQTVQLTPSQISEHLQLQFPDLPRPKWEGAPQVRVSRATRMLRESEVLEMLNARLSEKLVKGDGDLELRLNRTWNPVRVPDEPLTLEIYDLPATGLNSYLILRFDLADPRERIGTWQVAAQAKLWRKIPVAGSSLRRGQLLRESDCVLERRDVLATREALAPEDLNKPGLELTRNIDPGMPILTRSVRIRPLVERGHVVDAVVQNGLLNISMKVQVLEDGRPGQLIRVRNLKSRREFYGKVQDENTVLVSL